MKVDPPNIKFSQIRGDSSVLRVYCHAWRSLSAIKCENDRALLCADLYVASAIQSKIQVIGSEAIEGKYFITLTDWFEGELINVQNRSVVQFYAKTPHRLYDD